MKWTLIFRFYESLDLGHLERSLYSLSRQTIKPDEYLFFDNNSPFSEYQIRTEIAKHFDLNQWIIVLCRHASDNTKTLAWANNRAIRMATHDHFAVMRSDMIFDFEFCARLLLRHLLAGEMSFVSAWYYCMDYVYNEPVEKGVETNDLEQFGWRMNPKNLLANSLRSQLMTETEKDACSYFTSKAAMNAAGWYDEFLTGWGFEQQDLQTHMVRAGVKMVVIAEVLAYHMHHDLVHGERDLGVAREIWLKSPRRIPEIKAEEERLKRERSKLRRLWKWINR